VRHRHRHRNKSRTWADVGGDNGRCLRTFTHTNKTAGSPAVPTHARHPAWRILSALCCSHSARVADCSLACRPCLPPTHATTADWRVCPFSLPGRHLAPHTPRITARTTGKRLHCLPPCDLRRGHAPLPPSVFLRRSQCSEAGWQARNGMMAISATLAPSSRRCLRPERATRAAARDALLRQPPPPAGISSDGR